MKQIIFVLIIVLFLAGCEETSLNQQTIDVRAEEEIMEKTEQITVENTEPEISIALSTDKELYHSNEIMKVTVDIECNIQVRNATLRVYGIHASRYRLDKNQAVNLEPGNNTVVIDYKTPSCNRCSGIRPGTYEVSAELSYGGIGAAKATKNIEIQQ